VAAATFAVFLPALGAGFVNWDDDENFLWNPSYRGLGWREIRWMFTAVHQGLYIPVTWLTLGLDHVIWGMDPFGYHLTSVTLHAVNAALLYAVARRLLGAAFPDQSTGHALGAAVAALLFSVHPLRAESVAWVTERRDVVVGLLTLVTVLAYLTAWRRGNDGRLHRGWYWTAVACFGLALLAKSIAVGLPLVLLALDRYPLRRRRAWSALVVEKLPFVVLSAAVAALTVGILASRGLFASRETLSVPARLALAAYGLAFYLWKTVVPGPLSPIYPLVLPVRPWTPEYLLPAALVILITAAVVLARRRWLAGWVTWGAYVVLIAPVLGLAHSGPQIVADRYSYLACIPFALLAGAGVTWTRRRAAEGNVSPLAGASILVAAGAVLVILSAQTVQQVKVWRDSVTLWEHASAVVPDSDLPIFYLGWALVDARRPDDARAHFTRALARVPDSLPGLRAQFLVHRGIVEQRAGRPAEAEQDFRGALGLDPVHAVAMVRWGDALLALGRGPEADRALSAAVPLVARGGYPVWEVRQAVEGLSPAARRETRGRLAVALGLLFQQRDATAQAEAAYRRAIDAFPESAEAWNNLGVTLALRQADGEALAAFRTALRVDPRYPPACENARRAAARAGASPPELAACGGTR
jgi:tetratricopeptide (TPR) repeat protein